ncbi:GyrI-like domain-containing protein [bacterium]|nr:GyrI-like domain-containing protein [bacterium]
MPKIEVKTHPSKTIVGLKYHGTNEKNEIPGLWDQLMPRAGEIPHRDFSTPAAYGINIMGPEFEETHEFDYIAGFPVEQMPEEMPEGMAAFTVREGEYGVIVCPNLASLSQAYEAIYNRWLPESDYELDLSGGNFCFELYTEEFNPPEGSEKLYIYVPVKAK